MLIINPYVFGAAGALALSFVASATSSGTTITIPTTAQAGDIAVLLQVAGAASTPPTAVTPTGFTNARNNSVITTDARRAMMDYKLLVGGDPGASIAGMNGSATDNKIILIFRPSALISAVTAFSPVGQATTGNPSLISVSTSGQSAPVVIAGQAYGSDGSIIVSGSLATNGTTVNGTSSVHYGLYEIQNDTLTNRSLDMTDFGTSAIQACGFAVS